MGSRGGEYERGALILSRALVLLYKRYFKSSPSASPNFTPARNPCTA